MTGTPTQVAHPWKAVLRTLVASAVGAALAWLSRTLGIDLTDLDDAIIDSLTVAVWAVGLGVAQWLLTHPRLLPIWEGIGLGTGTEREASYASSNKAKRDRLVSDQEG